jgi:hypothetical protein
MKLAKYALKNVLKIDVSRSDPEMAVVANAHYPPLTPA